jgi:hypothetical protein
MWWKLVGGAVAIGLAAFLLTQYGASRYREGRADERTAHAEREARIWQQTADERVAAVQRNADALVAYAATVERAEPVIVRSINTVREYAQTNNGAGQCLPAERVLGIERSAAELGLDSIAAAGAVDAAVPSDPARHAD